MVWEAGVGIASAAELHMVPITTAVIVAGHLEYLQNQTFVHKRKSQAI